jgi:hypothetical protein
LLPLLRLMAMFTLAVSFLKPVAMRLASVEERGSIVVLVDRSRSMSVIDNARSPAQLVALADALGKLPPKLRSNSATTLAAGLARLSTAATEVRGAREDLDYARVAGRDVQFRQGRLKDAAASYAQIASELAGQAQGLPNADELKKRFNEVAHVAASEARDDWRMKAPEQLQKAVAEYQKNADDDLYQSNADVRKSCDEIAALSRFALVEQAMLRPDGIMLGLRKEASVIGFGLASDLTPWELAQANGIAGSLNMAPDGNASDLTAGIAHAVSGRSVRAVVLFSDGRQVGGDPTIVSGLTPNGVPVFTVCAAASDPPHDISFAAVSAPSSVFANQSIKVTADLRHIGFNGATVDLHCKFGEEVEQSQKISIHDDKPAKCTFRARLTKPGVQRVRVWFPALKGEASADNNQVERWVKVVPDHLKVLLVAGSPTWDFQYVRNALSRLQEIDLKDVVLDPANQHLTISARDILSQDVILLMDVPRSALDDQRWDAVERVAQVTGGSVIIIPGESHPVSEYYENISAATLLPFRDPFKPAWVLWAGDDPSFHFAPTPDAEAMDLFKLPAEAPANSDSDVIPRRWEQLPGCMKFLQLPEINDKNWKPQAHALLVEEESHLPVLSEMRVGAGRAYFLGLDETWRWRLKVGMRDQEQFWRQLVQRASEPPYFAHDGPLALDTDKVSADPGETIHVRARIRDDTPESASPFVLQVLRSGRPISDHAMAPIGGGRFTVNLALPVGDYEIRWNAVVGQKMRSVKMPLHVSATGEPELADLSGDSAMLQKLAQASGGEFLTLEQVDGLPRRLAAVGDARSRFAELSIWDSKYLFILVVGCFGVEWGLRKRLGLT